MPISRHRALNPSERALLDSGLSALGDGASPWAAQAAAAKVAGVCACGCGTIELSVPGAGDPGGEGGMDILVEGVYEEGDLSFLILLFTMDGRLSSLEIVPPGDDPPASYPAPRRVQWHH